jgi:hypothetical protein
MIAKTPIKVYRRNGVWWWRYKWTLRTIPLVGPYKTFNSLVADVTDRVNLTRKHAKF